MESATDKGKLPVPPRPGSTTTAVGMPGVPQVAGERPDVHRRMGAGCGRSRYWTGGNRYRVRLHPAVRHGSRPWRPLPFPSLPVQRCHWCCWWSAEAWGRGGVSVRTLRGEDKDIRSVPHKGPCSERTARSVQGHSVYTENAVRETRRRRDRQTKGGGDRQTKGGEDLNQGGDRTNVGTNVTDT